MSKAYQIMQSISHKSSELYRNFTKIKFYYWTFFVGFFGFFGGSFFLNYYPLIKLLCIVIALICGIKFLVEFGKHHK